MGTKRSETFLMRREFSAGKVPSWVNVRTLALRRTGVRVNAWPLPGGRHAWARQRRPGVQPLLVPRPTARAGGAPWRLSVGSWLLLGWERRQLSGSRGAGLGAEAPRVPPERPHGTAWRRDAGAPFRQ